MQQFETGVARYIHAQATVDVFFPVDSRGNADICCAQCYFFSQSSSRCRLNGKVCEYPNKYVGGGCPLTEVEKEKN